MIFSAQIPPAVLLFNVKQDERAASLETYLKRRGISLRFCTVAEQQQSLGALLALPGYAKRPYAFAKGFSEELMVMAGFSSQELDGLLAFFKTEGLRRIALKAMLTPTNAAWTPAELLVQLKREEESLRRRL